MKAIVLSTMYPNSKIYLSGVFVHEQVKRLRNMGVDVVVLSPIPCVPFFLKWLSKKWSLFSKIPNYEVIEDIPVYHTRYIAIPKGFLRAYWGYGLYYFSLKLVKKLNSSEKISLIHAHGSSPDDYGGYLLSKKLNIPYVLTVHGDSVYSLINFPSRFKNSKKAMLNADAVIGVSSKVTERISKITGRTQGVYKIYNGYNKVDTSKLSQKSSEKINILFAANLIERKGCEQVLRAIAILKEKHKNLKLVIAGGGKLFKKMTDLAEKLNISNFTEFEGNVIHNELIKLMSKCDIFILPSYNEALGVVYLEAMSLKKPIIASYGEGITDLVEDHVSALLVFPQDIKNIAEKLEWLITDKDLRNKIGEEGYKIIKDLTWEKNAKKTIEVYNKIL
jgi:hypothetical protein